MDHSALTTSPHIHLLARKVEDLVSLQLGEMRKRKGNTTEWILEPKSLHKGRRQAASTARTLQAANPVLLQRCPTAASPVGWAGSSTRWHGKQPHGPALHQGWVSTFVFTQRQPKAESICSMIYFRTVVLLLLFIYNCLQWDTRPCPPPSVHHKHKPCVHTKVQMGNASPMSHQDAERRVCSVHALLSSLLPT